MNTRMCMNTRTNNRRRHIVVRRSRSYQKQSFCYITHDIHISIYNCAKNIIDSLYRICVGTRQSP
jgi:hypothetical protein